MAVWVLGGSWEGELPCRAVLVDSDTMTAFGPVFEDADEARAFLAWYEGRSPELRSLLAHEILELVGQSKGEPDERAAEDASLAPAHDPSAGSDAALGRGGS